MLKGGRSHRELRHSTSLQKSLTTVLAKQKINQSVLLWNGMGSFTPPHPPIPPQVSFAEKEARKLLDPEVRFQSLVQLVQLWGVPLERPADTPATASKPSGAPPPLVG